MSIVKLINLFLTKNRMKKTNFLVLISLFLEIIFCYSVFAVRINEIMYNPQGDDNNREYIELYSDEIINLSGYILSDGDSNDTLKQARTSESRYSIIVEDEYNFSDLNQTDVSVYFIGVSIGNGLSEDDVITVYDKNKQILDSVQINKSLGNGNNKSMSFYNTFWTELEPTPGYENKKEEIIVINNSQSNQSEINNTFENNTQINDNQTEPQINQTIETNNTINTNQTESEINQTTVNNTESNLNQTIVNQTTTVNLTAANQTINYNNSDNTNNTNKNITQIINLSDNSCDISIDISTDKDTYENHEKISFYNKLNYDKISYIIEYWAEDSDGDTIKNKVQTTNQNKKSYTPKKSIDGKITIKAIVRNLSCKDINPANNQFNKTISIKKDPNNEEDNEDDTGKSSTKEKSSKNTTKLSYEIVNFQKTVKVNESFEIEIKIQNNNQENSFELSSYVYKGSKCYSAGRDENKVTATLGKGEVKTVKLKDVVVTEINGTYNFKVKIKKNAQKTFKELKEQIVVEKTQNSNETEEDEQEIVQKKQSEGVLSSKKNINSENSLEEIAENRSSNVKVVEKTVAYEAPSEKLKRNINYLVLFVSATVTLVTVWKYEGKGNKGKD